MNSWSAFFIHRKNDSEVSARSPQFSHACQHLAAIAPVIHFLLEVSAFLPDFTTLSKRTAVHADIALFPAMTPFPGSQDYVALKTTVTNPYQKEAKGNDLNVGLAGTTLRTAPFSKAVWVPASYTWRMNQAAQDHMRITSNTDLPEGSRDKFKDRESPTGQVVPFRLPDRRNATAVKQ